MSDESTTPEVEPEGAVAEASADRPAAVADEVLLKAADVARAALYEITPRATVGAPAGHLVEGERVLSLLFENTLPGYPGWYWTVSLSREVDSDEVNVLEAELMPGETALLAPDWVPWADRLAEYQAQKKAEREAAVAAGEPEPEDDFVSGDELEGAEDDESDDDLDGEDDDLDSDDLDDDEDHEDDDDDLSVDDDDDDFDEDDELEFDESDDIQDAEAAALADDEEE
ncbi:MAG: DUF3027 domain-containing protein [Microbacteriaceae bacterium]|nr:DUF3027 domain-containing protein [Microbacteriaceae bacterium]MCL2796115.1 DUF3027 domain-containing protein [Microbacteriaceae bacterium]